MKYIATIRLTGPEAVPSTLSQKQAWVFQRNGERYGVIAYGLWRIFHDDLQWWSAYGVARVDSWTEAYR